MNCPKCKSTEIDSGGFCLVCGLRTMLSEESQAAEAPDPAAAGSPDGAQSIVGAAPSIPSDLPEWRQELSRRLQEIKMRREENGIVSPTERVEIPEAIPPVPASAEGEMPSEPAKPAAAKRSRRAPRAPERDQPPAAAQIPAEKPAAEESPMLAGSDPGDLEEPSLSLTASDVVVRTSPHDVEARRLQYTQDLIDSVVARLGTRQTQPAAPRESRSAPAPATESIPPPEPAPAPAPGLEIRTEPDPERRPAITPRAEDPIRTPRAHSQPKTAPALDFNIDAEISSLLHPERADDKLILLSRMLAGLVDLILVLLFTGLIIISVDVLEGIEVFDAVSQLHYAALSIVLYFAYSIFFLGMSGQTIGMMLTDLRLVGRRRRKVPMGRILVRCLLYLPCLALFGIGLLWGFFDKRTRCLHDLLSKTRVMRIAQD
jgi:uncharacterized RDD family membrane protein YckC